MNNRRLARAAARLVAARKVRHHPRGRRPLRPRSVPGHRRLSAPCLLRRDAAARRRERQRQRAKRRANRRAAAGPEGRTGRDSALGEVQRLLAREPVLARQARRRPFLRRQLGMGDGTVQARPLRWRSGGGGGRRRQGGAEGGKGSEPPRAGLPGRTLNRRGGGGTCVPRHARVSLNRHVALRPSFSPTVRGVFVFACSSQVWCAPPVVPRRSTRPKLFSEFYNKRRVAHARFTHSRLFY